MNIENDKPLNDVNGNDLEKILGSEVTSVKEYKSFDAPDSKDIVCGFLDAYGSRYDVIVTAQRAGCFTWVFSRNGRVVSMQSIYLQARQQHRAYTTDGITIVGISCNC